MITENKLIKQLTDNLADMPACEPTSLQPTRHTGMESISYITCPACHVTCLLPDGMQPRQAVKCAHCNTIIGLTETDRYTPSTRNACIGMMVADHVFKETHPYDDYTDIHCSCGWMIRTYDTDVRYAEYEHLCTMYDHVTRGLDRFVNLMPINVKDARKGDMVRLRNMTDRLKVIEVSDSGNAVEVELGSGLQPAWIQRMSVMESFRPLPAGK